jgi:hypothetical protein
VWTCGGMEESGMASVMRESTVGWEGDLVHNFFWGKTEVSTSWNCLPEIWVIKNG